MKTYFIDTRDVVQYAVPQYVKGKTLDIGGGSSKYRSIITKHAGEYVVADLFPGPGVDVVTDVRDMSFDDEIFDTVLSFQVLEHVDDTTAAVREIHRVLRKGGHVIVTAPFLGAQHGDPSDFHRFTPEGLAWYFEQAGFTIVESGKQGSTFSVLAELLRFVFLNPYKKYGAVRTKVFTTIVRGLKFLDRKGFLRASSLFTNSYIIVEK